MDDNATSGFFWHVHHDLLLEYSGDIQERIEYIKTRKPAREIDLRLRLMRPVKGILHPDVVALGLLLYKCSSNGQAELETCQSVRRTINDLYRSINAQLIPIKEFDAKLFELTSLYRAALDNYEASMIICNQAYTDYACQIQLHIGELLELHALECPNCPWDGSKIVFPL